MAKQRIRLERSIYDSAQDQLLTTYLQTQLPPDYIELEKRVDALKQVHQKMLQVTCVFQFCHTFIFNEATI